MLSPDLIESNYVKFRALCEKVGDRSEAVLAMVDALGERLALCPASGRLQYHLAVPGGLVDHSLRVLKNANALVKTFGWEVSKSSLIIGCLFHDIGKCSQPVGEGFEDYYLPQTSDWHRDKLGETYKHNEKIPYLTVPHRGVFLMQHYGIKLTRDEWLAIVLNDGWLIEENKQYCLKEPPLAHVVMTSDYISTYQEKTAWAAENEAEKV